jgi:hypothetical protein
MRSVPKTSLAGTTTAIPPAELRTYHRNPRRGDVPAIARSLQAHDQYRPLVVNIGTATGRPNEVLAGNHTLLAVRQLASEYPDDPRWQQVKVHWGDWDDDQCRKIVAADNRTAELGGYDTAELVALLNEMPAAELPSVGYSTDDLADLAAVLEETITDPIRDDGLINSRDLEATGADYADRLNTRMFVLMLPIQQFVWAQTQLAAYRAEYDLDNNSEALLGLLAAWSKTEPPVAEVAEVEDAPA